MVKWRIGCSRRRGLCLGLGLVMRVFLNLLVRRTGWRGRGRGRGRREGGEGGIIPSMDWE